MTFAEPQLLWLLVVPVLWLGFEIWRKSTPGNARWPRIARRWAGPRGVEDATRASLSGPRWRLMFGLALSCFALARPQAGQIEEKTFESSREVLLALDLSRSMLAEDVKPNRLTRARLLIETLLNKLKGERVGLLLFSGTAFLQSPLSADYEVLREFLPSLDPEYLPEGGTDYDQMLRVALESFSNEAGADRYLIVLSDGESQTEGWRNRLDALKEKRVRVVSLGLGTAGGSVMPLKDGGFVKDERGAVVMSRLEPATLQELASATSGAYVNASEWIDLPAILAQTVERGSKSHAVTRTTVRLREQYQWFLGAALVFLAWSYWIEFPVRPRAREVARRSATNASRAASAASPAAATATVASLLLLGGMVLALGATSPLHAATYVPPPASSGSPGSAPAPSMQPRPAAPGATNDAVLPKIVERLAAKSALDAADCAHLARETISFGESELAGQHRPKPGVVHDGLAAVDLGERLDPKAADWADLREKLKHLLEEPPSQQQEQQQQQDDKDKKDEQQKQDQQQQQQQQNQPSQQNSDSQQDDAKKSDDPNQQSKDSPPQDSKNQDSQSKSDPSQSQPPQDPKNSQNPQNDDAQKQNQDPAAQTPRQKAFDAPKDPPASGSPGEEPPQPPAENQPMQTIGGEKPASDEVQKNPQLAVPLQKLDAARAQDSPGRLFKLMQRDSAPPQKPKKDW